jgi:hypothetical protein
VSLFHRIWDATQVEDLADEGRSCTKRSSRLAVSTPPPLGRRRPHCPQVNQESAAIEWELLRTWPGRRRSYLICVWPSGCCMSTNTWSAWMIWASMLPGHPRAHRAAAASRGPGHAARDGGRVSQVLTATLACFADNAHAAAEQLPSIDAAVDRLNHHIFRQLDQITVPTAIAWAPRSSRWPASWSGSPIRPWTSASRSHLSSPARFASCSPQSGQGRKQSFGSGGSVSHTPA